MMITPPNFLDSLNIFFSPKSLWTINEVSLSDMEAAKL